MRLTKDSGKNGWKPKGKGECMFYKLTEKREEICIIFAACPVCSECSGVRWTLTQWGGKEKTKIEGLKCNSHEIRNNDKKNNKIKKK